MKHSRKLILTALIVLALTGISFFGGPVTYMFLALVVLVPLSSIIYIFLVIFSLRIYQRSDGRDMVARTPSDFYITLKNETFFSFSSIQPVFYSSFSTVTGLEDNVVYELPPHSGITRKTGLLCRYRGEYLVGIKEIIVGDPLGLFSVTYRIKEPLSVIVSPAMIRLEGLSNAEELPDEERDNPAKRTEVGIPVREYVAGDDPRLIHHKASALMQKPMVRELTGSEGSGIALIMDSSRHDDAPEDYLPVENRLIESTLALSLYFIERGIPVDVIYMAENVRCENVSRHNDYERLYSELKGYSFREKDATSSLLDTLAHDSTLMDHRMLIFILNRADAGTISLIEKVNTYNIPSRIYVAGTEPADREKILGEGSEGIICIGTKLPTEDVL